MSILTDRIAVRLAAFYNEHYPGQDYERSEFLGEADVVVAVVREVLLSDEAVNASAEAMYQPSLWHGGDSIERMGMRSHAWQGLRAALDAVTTREEA